MGAPLTPTAFVREMRPALRQAAAIARALEGRVENEPKPGETRAAKAALTIADTAAQEAILVPLFERWPELCIEAEEDTATAALFPRNGPAQVVVDPIDGTLHSYLGRRGPYAVMVGLAIAERYEGSLVALPREGLILDAARGEGARLAIGDHPPGPALCDGSGSRVLVSPELPQPILDALRAAGLEPKAAAGGAIAVAPALPGVRAGLRLAHGSGSISTRGRIGILIAREAGARALAADGEPFPDDLSTPSRALAIAADGDPVLTELLAAVNAD